MKGERKAQFTIFALLGLVIVIIVGLFIFSINQVFSQNLDAQAREAVQDFLSSGPINYYVDNCLELATNEAVEEFVNHKHILNFDDAYNHEFIPLQVGGKTINVSYWIKKQQSCNIVQMQKPDYPLANTSLNNLQNIYNTNVVCTTPPRVLSGFFGKNTFPRLCFPGSDNIFFISPDDQLFSPCNLNIYSDLPNFLPQNPTNNFYNLENILATSINKSMDQCANFSIFNDLQGHNVTMLDDPVFDIIFQPESFSVKATYPFEVKLRNRQPVITSYSFEYQSDIRITKLQRFIIDLLRRETQNIFFNASRDYNQALDYDENINVTRIDFIDSDIADDVKFDWILNITDTLSLLNQTPLSIFVGIQNRKPALDYIRTTNPTNPFHIVAVQNESITLTPRGYDPDDREVQYLYSGWREDYDQRFRLDDPNCSFEEIQSLEDLENCVELIEYNSEDDRPRNWTRSDLFQETFRDAKIHLNESDIGPRNVTITIRDIAGLIDYQVIKILVFDLPTAVITINNLIPGPPDGVVSVEDPFEFSGQDSAPPSIGVGNEIVSYHFKSFLENSLVDPLFQKTTIYPNASINIPDDVNDQISNIRTIGNLLLNIIGKHIFELTVTANIPWLNDFQLSDTTEKEIEVVSCFPHRASSPSYPYNNNLNPYLANHTCCLGNMEDVESYQLANEETSCYQQDRFGVLDSLKDHADSLHIDITNIESVLNKNYGEQNYFDVYKLEFERACDGTRGNICAGNSVATIQVYDSCPLTQQPEIINDQNIQNFELTDSCTGPVSLISEESQSCINYPQGQTFDSRFSIEDNICGNADDFCGGITNTQTCDSFICDGQGGCTIPTECSCTINSCGAECDASNTYVRDGNTCRFGCDLSFCSLQQNTDLPCEEDYCLNNDFNGNNGDYCYYDLSCASSGGSYKQQICIAGTRVNEQGNQDNSGNYCLIDSAEDNKCTAEGCNLPKQNIEDFNSEPCSSPPQCTPSGWTCTIEENDQ